MNILHKILTASLILLITACTAPSQNRSERVSTESPEVVDGTAQTDDQVLSTTEDEEFVEYTSVYDDEFNKDPLFRIYTYEDGLYHFGYINRDGDVVIEPKFFGAEKFSEGLAPAAVGTVDDFKWGFIDRTGEFVIEPEYCEVGPFSEGLARFKVCDEESEANGLYGFIDREGNIAIEPRWEYIRDFSEGRAFYIHDGWPGFINKYGEQVISLSYEYGDFIAGIAACLEEDESKYINRNGDVVLDLHYSRIRHHSDGLAAVMKDGMSGYIDTGGNVVIPLVWNMVTDFSEGIAWVSDLLNWKAIDTEGNVLFETDYLPAGPFSEGLSPVTVPELNLTGYMDINGEMVIDSLFTVAEPFENGLAMVRFDGGYGYIGHDGLFVFRQLIDDGIN